jgi:hypothetical protein
VIAAEHPDDAGELDKIEPVILLCGRLGSIYGGQLDFPLNFVARSGIGVPERALFVSALLVEDVSGAVMLVRHRQSAARAPPFWLQEQLDDVPQQRKALFERVGAARLRPCLYCGQPKLDLVELVLDRPDTERQGPHERFATGRQRKMKLPVAVSGTW